MDQLIYLIPVALFLGLLKLLLRDFVVPIMYKRDLTALDAFRVFRQNILTGRVGPLFLFYLMALVMGLAAAILIVLGTCITCCLAALPYISSVVFLPVFVFFRCYSLYFLEQVGPEWRIIERPEGRPPPHSPAVATPDLVSSSDAPGQKLPSQEAPGEGPPAGEPPPAPPSSGS